jgi:hypothetical protein
MRRLVEAHAEQSAISVDSLLHLLIETVVRQEQDHVVIAQNVLCILEAPLNVLPQNNTQAGHGIIASGDGDDFGGGRSPKRLRE